jgi:hypothetical protein
MGAAIICIVTAGALIFTLQAFDDGSDETKSAASGAVYMSVFAMAVVLNIAIIVPGLLLLQPLRLWRVMRSLRRAITPRQRFRGKIVPDSPNLIAQVSNSFIPTTIRSYICYWSLYLGNYFCFYVCTHVSATWSRGCCIAATNSYRWVFCPCGTARLFSDKIGSTAHRFLVGYVFGRTRSQTGGLLQIWLLRRFATLLPATHLYPPLRNADLEAGILKMMKTTRKKREVGRRRLVTEDPKAQPKKRAPAPRTNWV